MDKEKRAGTFKIIENWEVTSKDLEGNILSNQKICNLIVNSGLNMVRDLLGGFNSQTEVIAIAIGTGTTAAANADTTLEIEYTREASTNSSPANYQVNFTKTFTFASGESEFITEAGLFDDSISGGVMLARVVFAAEEISSEIELIVSATITISRI